jgi:secondary thiamine-phosphate synthase enzyme
MTPDYSNMRREVRMKILSDELSFSTRGFCDLKDLTGSVDKKVIAHGLKNGTVTLFVPGSTGGLTTIEYEGGLIRDFDDLMERLAPSGVTYHHDARWGDGNGFSHLRSAMIGTSLTVPFTNGKLLLGTWQQIVFIDFDNRPRSRTVHLQFIAE